MNIVAATPEDQATLWPMLAELHRHEGVGEPGERVAQALAVLLADPGLGQVFLARDGGKAVAYAVVVYGFSLEFQGVDAFLDELYVSEGLRGRGLGGRLIDAAEEHCRRHGVVALHLEVGLRNPRARALYRRRGFVDHDRHLMTKRLA